MAAKLLRALTSFRAAGERRRFIHVGDLVPANDLVVKGREHLFEPVEGQPKKGKDAAS